MTSEQLKKQIQDTKAKLQVERILNSNLDKLDEICQKLEAERANRVAA